MSDLQNIVFFTLTMMFTLYKDQESLELDGYSVRGTHGEDNG